MSSSLLTGVTGLQANQEMLDVVGNNLANMNTVGFKAQSINFSDLIYQTLSAAGGTNTAQASGTDPVQIGLGVGTASISTNQTQGGLQSTGRDLDVAIQGGGYFILKSPNGSSVYTRAGSFGIDSQGFLVDPSTGYRVQRTGTIGDPSPTATGFQIPANNDIQIPQDSTIPGRPTSTITIQGNLDSSDQGPVAQVLQTPPLTAGGVPADSTTPLNSLDGNTADYVSGDTLTLTGTDAAGTAVNIAIPVDGTTTVGDLLSAINTSFPSSTAALSSAGNLVITANAPGTTNLNLTIGDNIGDTGKTAWATNAPTVATPGSDGAAVNGSIQVYDAQGAAHDLSFSFPQKYRAKRNLELDHVDESRRRHPLPRAPDDRHLCSTTTALFQRQVNGAHPAISIAAHVRRPHETSTQNIAFNFGTPGNFSGITQVGGGSSAAATLQNGYSAGSLTDVAIDQDGVINGNFSNGQSLQIAQLGIASFANQDALDRIGNNYFSSTTESGPAQISSGEAGGNGAIEQKVLEESNVDVSLEFTRLITAQRGFEINAKTITVSDEVLQVLANIVQ